MTYFHIRTYTIIGAKSFHCPVRDGKEWDQLAMVVRHNCYQPLVSGFQLLAADVIGRSKAGVDCIASVTVYAYLIL
jgi:hypothetical protein